jgi:hypothetical protein
MEGDVLSARRAEAKAGVVNAPRRRNETPGVGRGALQPTLNKKPLKQCFRGSRRAPWGVRAETMRGVGGMLSHMTCQWDLNLQTIDRDVKTA